MLPQQNIFPFTVIFCLQCCCIVFRFQKSMIAVAPRCERGDDDALSCTEQLCHLWCPPPLSETPGEHRSLSTRWESPPHPTPPGGGWGVHRVMTDERMLHIWQRRCLLYLPRRGTRAVTLLHADLPAHRRGFPFASCGCGWSCFNKSNRDHAVMWRCQVGSQ